MIPPLVVTVVSSDGCGLVAARATMQSVHGPVAVLLGEVFVGVRVQGEPDLVKREFLPSPCHSRKWDRCI
jgi:hypothetical protein